MNRREILEFAAERVTDAVEIIKEECGIDKAEDSYATILIALVREFKAVLSVGEMAYGLNSVAAQILHDDADFDMFLRESFPKNLGNPEMN